MINFIRASKKGYFIGLILSTLAAISAGCVMKAETIKKPEPPAPKREAATTQTPGYRMNRDPYEERDFEGDMDYPAPAPTVVSRKITKADFYKIKTGMTLEEVENFLGDKGMLVSTMDVNGRKTRIYKWSSDNFTSYLDVTIENGKVVEKKEKGLK